MRQFSFRAFGLIFFLFSCASDDDSVLTIEDRYCFEGNYVEEKSLAKNLILGNWVWIKTIFPWRTGITIDTPESKNESRTFEFTEEKLRIYINGNITSERGYEVQFWAEGTTMQEELLVVKYDNGSRSMLRLSTSGKHLALINSFDDAGGNICLQRE